MQYVILIIRMSCLVLCVVLLSFDTPDVFSMQVSNLSNRDRDLASTQLENVQIEAQSIGSLFSELSLFYEIPIGVEIARADDDFTNYHIEFKKGTLSDLLTQVVGSNKQYDWEIKDGVVTEIQYRFRVDHIESVELPSQ